MPPSKLLKKLLSLPPPQVGCRHFKQATCSWPAPLSHKPVKVRQLAHKFRKGEHLSKCVSVKHTHLASSELSVCIAGIKKFTLVRFSGARHGRGRLWASLMVTYRCKDPSDNRPLIIINVTGAGPVPPPSHNNNGPSLIFLRLFISSGSVLQQAVKGEENTTDVPREEADT